MIDAGDTVGSYRLGKELGRGGCGRVFRAQHVLLGRTVAIKILDENFARDHQYVSRFFHEARIVNQLRHPNIIDIVDFLDIREPRCLAYVMEYLEGLPLYETLGLGLPLHKVAQACLQINSALRTVHALGVVHRDLKPENIFVLAADREDWSQTPSLKVLDFGFAKFDGHAVSHRTGTGVIVGTPAYVAPEQLYATAVSPATDVYAVGEILYEMLTGCPLFLGSKKDLVRQKLTGQPASPLELPGLPQEKALIALIKRCTALQPEERPTLDEIDDIMRPFASPALTPEYIESLDIVPPPRAPSIAPAESADIRLSSLFESRIAESGLIESRPSHPAPSPALSGSAMYVPRRPVAAWVVGGGLALALVAAIAALPGFLAAHARTPAAHVAALPTRSVHLTSEPGGALIVDRETQAELGRTPTDIAWMGGSEKYVELRLGGFHPMLVRLDADAGASAAQMVAIEADAPLCPPQPAARAAHVLAAEARRPAVVPAPAEDTRATAEVRNPAQLPGDMEAQPKPLRRDETTRW